MSKCLGYVVNQSGTDDDDIENKVMQGTKITGKIRVMVNAKRLC